MHLNLPNKPSNEDEMTTMVWTVAAALNEVARREHLSRDERKKMTRALKQLCKATAMPPESLVLTPGVLRDHPLAQAAAVHHVSARSMRGTRSGLRDVLELLDIIDPPYPPLNDKWQALMDKLDPKTRGGISQFAHYCSMMDITRGQVDGQTVMTFRTYLETRTAYTKPGKLAATVRLIWNRSVTAVPDWPTNRLPPQSKATDYTKPLSAFPLGFQQDHAAFGARLAGTALNDDDPYADDPAYHAEVDGDGAGEEEPELVPLARALRPSTVALRQDHCRWAASALVASGVPIDTITSLGVLVDGQNPNRILRFLYERGGCKPNAALSHVGETLRIIAKYHVRLPAREVARIQSLANRNKLQYKQMTLKNERTVRAAMRPETEAKLLALPDELMKVARRLHNTNPSRAASLALRAMLIKFLLHIPLRLENVRMLRFDTHLHRADPLRSLITGILIEADETKNDNPIVASVAHELGAVMETWITRFWAIKAAPGCPYVIAGDGTCHKPMCKQAMRDAVRQTTLRYLGVAITPHQFRHLAAKRYLRAYPGEYEAVRQMLGHKTVETTRRAYAGSNLDATLARHDALLTTPTLDVRRKSSERRTNSRGRGGKS